ncbi:hypothetical protein [Novosphingobium mangrovi (ex Huang et al. 2023)]|uniref:Uncharacterized protein n=1 Tax=Novosphingobium mangrovi (ex Huang et al. 2023) TaxID=2976432 RepID=A0ABT2I8X2_9SPHN|nr:hypothetical protein [Novosphingobium mangrovi (ex Huang et al. 2023)]MCT2401224.1 hypothetical protein [Novosphingobium mangrovi (ex Huang et al. 2023)]
MNIAHDQKTCMTGHPQGRAGDAFTDYQLPLDWQDLRARLFAAYEIRTVLSQDTKPLRLRIRGSFDGCAASALTTYEDVSRSVNPTASAYFKPREAKISAVAGPSSTGRRG